MWGSANATPLLALHGWLDNAATFNRLAPLLRGFRLVAPDFPGHGLSEHLPTGMQYHFIGSVPVMVELVQQLGWKRYGILGHSMGAAIGSLIAAIQPKEVTGLFLIDSIGPMSDSAEQNVARLEQFVRRWVKEPSRATPRIFRDKDEMVQARQKVAAISAEGAHHLIERGAQKVDGGYTWRSDPRLTLPSSLRMTEEQVLAFLQKIHCPTKILWATEGLPGRLPYIKDQLEKRCQAVPQLEQQRLEGGHHLQLDTPESVAPAVQAFFDGLQN
ncbi:MAG: alpha/beta hydrolase [Bdellovibrionaceae bacterium]|nr:alpha/beta hydrolase [Bdellovibrionales bacterium]MCB9254633.1 alpha/beta hydrolase [Pseudobdellovibrionaceae bacterium]